MPISIFVIKRAKSGDQCAISEIIESLEPQLEQKCRKFYLKGNEHEDLMQVARIAVLKAINDFDPSFEVTFENFAIRICVTRQLYTLIAASTRASTEPLNQSISLETPVNIGDEAGALKLMDILDGDVDPIGAMVESENFSHIKNRLYDRLTELEESVFRQYEAGYSYKEIAKTLEVSDSKCVDNALMRIRKKAKSLWKELEAPGSE